MDTLLIIALWLGIGVAVATAVGIRDQYHPQRQWLAGDAYAPQWVYIAVAVVLGPILILFGALRSVAWLIQVIVQLWWRVVQHPYFVRRPARERSAPLERPTTGKANRTGD